ncbi:MAG: hypothetical protein PHP52_10245 [Bacteroidales bacterium]|nr:hypothetical protein [Bacteroidales bacterium]MDD4217715.1 hypothetical protein [Bacteroidales bacterium]MDY0142111.1 hypothetical protein [Bacteroidales bacterium]
MNRILNIVIIAVILTGVVVFNYSCRPEDPPKAVVTVIDEDNKPVEKAQVVVRAANSETAHTIVYLLNEAKAVADTQYTDKEGKVFYDFKYESIYKVEVTKGTDKTHAFVRRGVGVLILENDKTYETKIEINEQTVFN